MELLHRIIYVMRELKGDRIFWKRGTAPVILFGEKEVPVIKENIDTRYLDDKLLFYIKILSGKDSIELNNTTFNIKISENSLQIELSS